MSEGGAYGRQLGETFHLGEAPAFVARTLQKSEIAVTEIKCGIENNGLTAPIPQEDAFLVTLQLLHCPRHDLWLNGKPVETAVLPAGITCIYDLRHCPVANSISPFHSLHFYLPRRALDAIAEIEELPLVDEIDHNPGIGVDDPVIRGLGLSLAPAFARPDRANRIFVDHVTVAVAAHLLGAYGPGGGADEPASGGLTPRQLRRVEDAMNADLTGDISILSLAAECGLPVSRFRRAFVQSTGMLPHRWLLERRIDKAVDLLRQSRMTPSEVAQACGFVDESQLRAVMARVLGVSPEACRNGKEG